MDGVQQDWTKEVKQTRAGFGKAQVKLEVIQFKLKLKLDSKLELKLLLSMLLLLLLAQVSMLQSVNWQRC